MTNDTLRSEAEARIRARRCMLQLFGVWLGMAAFLTAVWAIGNRGFFWPIWPLGFVAFGMIVHVVPQFLPRRPTTDQVEREMERMTRN